MQRLQLDPEENLTRKQYLKRKKKQAKGLKKRSKITYIMIAVTLLLCVYVFSQFYIYSKENNFRYVEGEGVNKQAVYNVYYVTEGYTYDPVYSLNSINSDGFNDQSVFTNSGLSSIKVADKYIYGIKSTGLYRMEKGTTKLEMLVESGVKKYVVNKDRIYYIVGDTNHASYIDLNTKVIKDLKLDNSMEMLLDDENMYIVQDEKTKKTLVKYDKEGENKKTLTINSNVSYIIQSEDTIYYVNKKDANKIYKVKKDGSDEGKLSDITCVSDKGDIKEIDGSKYMFVAQGALYYINVGDNNTLWKYQFETSKNDKVISVPVEILQNISDTIFYKVKNEMGVYLYNYKTNFMSQVTKRKIKEFSVDELTKVEPNKNDTSGLSKN